MAGRHEEPVPRGRNEGADPSQDRPPRNQPTYYPLTLPRMSGDRQVGRPCSGAAERRRRRGELRATETNDGHRHPDGLDDRITAVRTELQNEVSNGPT